LFAMNVDLDEPLPRRRAELERLRQVHGSLRPDASVAPESDSPAHLAWWLHGERGRVRIEILLSPENMPRIQKLTITSVPEPAAALRVIAERLAGLLGEPGPSWPSDVALAVPGDRAAIERALRAAEALFGPVTLGAPIAGDGMREAAWRLVGERGELDLRLELDASRESVSKVAFVPRTMSGPVYAV
jgi:serine-type D-Ala-D-Ala carboxypeptidase/endopeptidase